MQIAIFVGFFFLFSLLVISFPAWAGSVVAVAVAVESDIWCLKSLKNSLQDPFGYLSSTWTFTQHATTGPGFLCAFSGIDCWHPGENRVLNIKLSDMGLQGQFPAGLSNCTTLTGLNISGNSFSGPIPSDIATILPFITFLDLSNNSFSGSIPPSIANCNFLNKLRLHHNRLWGPVPNEIGMMPRITHLDVSSNMLTGPLPTFYQSAPVLGFGNNPGLCGHPLEACHTHSAHHDNRPHFFHGFMIGWAVSVIFVLFVCSFAVPEIDVKKVTRWVNDRKRPRINPGSRLWPKWTLVNENRMISKMEKYAVRFTFAELSYATGNFSQDNVIGTGKMGTMYRATIWNTLFLAVKWFFNSEHLERQTASELLTLGRYKHRTLVPLIGFCLEKNHTLLVYKYMSNGNLYDWLHLPPRQGNVGIMGHWPLRFKIAIRIAEGMAWLHHNSNSTVLHGAISSKCILLDENFEPKISNFWEAKFIKSNSSILQRGDSQDLDSDKKDVYLFGIMLLELITGKEPQELASSVRNLSPTSLLAYFAGVLKLGGTLTNEGFGDEICQCLQLAKYCLRSNPSQRPSMVQIYETLTALVDCNTSFGNK